MKSSKKYAYHVVKGDSGWSVDIVRRVTSKKTVVTKHQGGFSTEAEADEWGKNEVDTFLKNLNLNEQKKRRIKNKEADDDLI